MCKKIKIVDIFSGIGGLSYGFEINDLFQIVFANDIDKKAAYGYSLNYKKTDIFDCDISDIKEENILKYGSIDIVLGGPPCQSYSTLGKRQMDDRANLFYEYLRILSILKPKLFIFENVKGLISMNKGNLFKEIIQLFFELGYIVDYKILNAAEYGVPQIRERLIIVGKKDNKTFSFPKPTHKLFVSLKDAIGDLPSIDSGENGNNKEYKYEPDNDFLKFVRKSNIISEHISPNNNFKLKEIMKTLKEGQSKDDLPENIRPKSGYSNTYAKMWWHAPAPTITRNFATPSSSRCIHPIDSRALTIREGARLQSFPDDFIFFGNDGDKKLQIGNAVPPLLSIALAKSISNYFTGE